MTVDKKRDFIINVLHFTLVSAIIYIAIKYGLVWFMPFVIGFGVAFLLKPVINFISLKLKINRKVIAAIIVILFYAIVGGLLSLAVIKIVLSLKDMLASSPEFYRTTLEPALASLAQSFENMLLNLDPQLVDAIKNIILSMSQSLDKILTEVSNWSISAVSSAVSVVPIFLVSIIFSIISSFFFAVDYHKITSFIMRQFSDKVKDIILDIKQYIVGTIFKFIKAYGILMSITFVELSIGLSILRVENAILVALLIAIVDILPVLGTGGVVIPWIAIEVILGNYPLAIGLAIVYIVITVVRNIIEPKVVGDQIGLHPLIILMCMFIGVKLFGFIGLFLLPIIVIILVNLNKNGKINILK